MSSLKGLDTDQIDKYLSNDSKFKGAYPCDQIPDFPDNEYAMIINVDNSNLPGSHWTALVIKGGNGYYFDSFGRQYNNQSFPLDYITNVSRICVGKKMKFQEKVLQSFHSNTCGEFCVYFIKQLDKGVAFSTIFHDFTENLKLNDSKIMKLYKD